MIARRDFITLLGGAGVTLPLVARAQQAGKPPTIGYLGATTQALSATWNAAFVRRLRELNFRVVAAGDSYNDTAMLGEAHRGFFFQPPASIVQAFPQFPVTRSYAELRSAIDAGFADLA